MHGAQNPSLGFVWLQIRERTWWSPQRKARLEIVENPKNFSLTSIWLEGLVCLWCSGLVHLILEGRMSSRYNGFEIITTVTSVTRYSSSNCRSERWSGLSTLWCACNPVWQTSREASYEIIVIGSAVALRGGPRKSCREWKR